MNNTYAQKIIYILVFSKAIQGKRFSRFGSNPGVGGTQFVSISLALYLAEAYPDWQVRLVSNSEVQLETAAQNIKQEIFDEATDFFKALALQEDQLQSAIILGTASLLKGIDPTLLKKFETRLVCWSHHPFDVGAASLVSKLTPRAVVCVGTYQFYSNKRLNARVYQIQNIFIAPRYSDTNQRKIIDRKNLNIVFLGALVPAKGFLEVAKAWKGLTDRFPAVKLHVIGSAGTYGLRSDSGLIPTSSDYAQAILNFIPEEDIHQGLVIFYGNLGEEKFDIIQKCDLAILNPTGYTEAFPASPLECMACGVPVIASDDHGMSDCMRFFPELVLRSPQDIVHRVEWLVADPLRYLEIQHRAIAVAQWFHLQREVILTRWIRLLEAILNSTDTNLDLAPMLPFYGSRRKLMIRRDIRPRLSVAKRLILSPLKALGVSK